MPSASAGNMECEDEKEEQKSLRASQLDHINNPGHCLPDLAVPLCVADILFF